MQAPVDPGGVEQGLQVSLSIGIWALVSPI